MDFIQEYEQMYLNELTLKYPAAMKTGYFEVSYKYKKPKSASQVEALIMKFLKLKGHQAQKITTMGVYRDNKKITTDIIGRTRIAGKGKWTPGTATKGAADISSSVYGVKVDWEVKFAKSDKQTKQQKDFETDVTRAGGYYIIVHNPDDFYDKYYKLMTDPKIITMKSMFY